ncbi:MAG TPA: sigma 54-interacting transcriptional regulator [Sorangium sp.]|nr:sigma 54-interacting transcriptional regulator [Sorangium sp.]
MASELFGHAEGSFTGAHQRHAGLFERARGGTLFLDEIGDISMDVQAMLLRALETGAILPPGESEERAVDVRHVGAGGAVGSSFSLASGARVPRGRPLRNRWLSAFGVLRPSTWRREHPTELGIVARQ